MIPSTCPQEHSCVVLRGRPTHIGVQVVLLDLVRHQLIPVLDDPPARQPGQHDQSRNAPARPGEDPHRLQHGTQTAYQAVSVIRRGCLYRLRCPDGHCAPQVTAIGQRGQVRLLFEISCILHLYVYIGTLLPRIWDFLCESNACVLEP